MEITKTILKHLGKGEEMIEHVKDRLGHDVRYAIDASKLKATGWEPQVHFEEGFAAMIQWYQDNEDWWRPLKDRNFEDYYKENYGS